MARHDGSAARWLDEDPAERPRVLSELDDTEQLDLGPAFDDPSWVRREHAFVNALTLALLSHEPGVVRSLLDMPAAVNLPREVREEAQAFTSLSRSSLRAPMQTLLYRHRLDRLLVEAERGDEP
jgi:hypothetical protein